jgi:uncharacterized membrane protein
MTLCIIPFVGWVLGIIGVFLLLKGIKELANYYQDTDIYNNTLRGLIYYIIAIIALAIAGATIGVGAITLGFGVFAGLAISIATLIVGLLVAFVFYILAASYLRKALHTLAQKSGEHTFDTAATLLWVGAFLTLLFGFGLFLMLVAWIFIVVGFFSMKPPQTSTYQPYNYTAQPTQSQSTQVAQYCPHCGAPVTSDALYCAHCGKQISA